MKTIWKIKLHDGNIFEIYHGDENPFWAEPYRHEEKCLCIPKKYIQEWRLERFEDCPKCPEKYTHIPLDDIEFCDYILDEPNQST